MLSGPGVAFITLGILKLFEKLVRFSGDAVNSISGLNRGGKEQAAIQQQIISYMTKNPQILKSINSGLGTEKQLHRDILANIKAENREMQQMEKVAGNIARNMAKAGHRIPTEGSGEGRIQRPKSSGYVPNFSAQAYEESTARTLGAMSGVKAKYHPKAKVRGRKGIVANDQEEVLSPKQMQKQYGVTPKGGEYTVLPKYGSVGKRRRKELKQKIEKAQKPLNLASGFTPNFVTTGDVDRWEKKNAGKGRAYGKKRVAKKAQSRKPSIANMLDFLGQDVNALPDKEIIEYSQLNAAGRILGNFHRSKAKGPTEATKERFHAMSGGVLGTSKTAGRKKDERTSTPIRSTEGGLDDRLLPVLELGTQKDVQGGATLGKGQARFGLIEKQIPGLRKKFDAAFHPEYHSMVSNMGAKMFQGIPNAAKMQKAFKPRKLSKDGEGPVKGIVFESFIRGMMQEEKQAVGQRVDIRKGGVRKPFRHLFPKELRDKPFEIRAGGLSQPKALQKMEESGISTSFKELGQGYVTTKSGTRKQTYDEAKLLALRKRPNFAKARTKEKGGPKSKIKRMVLDSDYLNQYYGNLPAGREESSINSSRRKTTKRSKSL